MVGLLALCLCELFQALILSAHVACELCDLLGCADSALNGEWAIVIADLLAQLVEPLLRKV